MPSDNQCPHCRNYGLPKGDNRCPVCGIGSNENFLKLLGLTEADFLLHGKGEVSDEH